MVSGVAWWSGRYTTATCTTACGAQSCARQGLVRSGGQEIMMTGDYDGDKEG